MLKLIHSSDPLPRPKTVEIREFWAWMAIYPDGSEGILSAMMDLPTGERAQTPLMASKRQTAEMLAPKAHEVCYRASLHAGGDVTLRLARFARDSQNH